MKRLIIAIALVLASPLAAASSCEKDIREIDKALSKPATVPAANVAEAKKLRAEGSSLCIGGKKDEARAVLRKAMRLLDLG